MESGTHANPAQTVLALRRALAADPGNRALTLGLMELYRQQGRLAEARALGEPRLVQDAGDRDLVRLMGLVYAELGETGALEDLLRAREGEGEAALDLGTHAVSVGQWATGVALLVRGAALLPERWDGWLTVVKALVHDHRLEEARARAAWLVEQPIADPELKAQAGFLLAVSLLLQGRLKEGLPWLACRFAMDGGPRLEPLPLRAWEGEDPSGRTLLLQAEQGFGDTFMLARYVDVLARRGARVLLRPQGRTQGVLATCGGLAGLAEGEMTLPADALTVPLMSLPALCGTELHTIPRNVPYLHVPARVPNRAAIDACLARAGTARRIGLVWAGNPIHSQDRERSMPPEVLDLLGDVPGVAWVDLQVAPGPRPSLPLLDLAPLLSDFSDTAYALDKLDLLVSVDSSPVHLAGAMGRPVWMALAWLPDWRWMLDRRDTPWYPTVELWRQPAPGDWAPVVLAMRERLLA